MSLAFLEYEEQFGRLWDRLVGGRPSWPRFPHAAVALEPERRRLAVLFRGMGGDPGLDLVAGTAGLSDHRLRLRQKLGMSEERLPRTERTAELVLLPPVLDFLPTAALNHDLYVWLIAFLAGAKPVEKRDDPLQGDVAYLRWTNSRTDAVLREFGGLRERYARLAASLVALRPARRLPPVEAEIEAAVQASHGRQPSSGRIAALVAEVERPLDGLVAPRGYRPFLPSPLWGEVRREAITVGASREEVERGDSDGAQREEIHRRARRRKLDNTERRDPLILVNKGDYLLVAAEAVDVNRPDDDGDSEAARKAADDMHELTLGSPDRGATSRISLNLDLAADTDPALESAAKNASYPEWDYRRRIYRPDFCTVRAEVAPETGADWAPDARIRRHIRLVRRRFEALRPQRKLLRAQSDGAEIDMDALVRARTDLAGSGAGSDRVYLATRNQTRDLAIAILVDTSFSTDSWIDGRRVLDVEKAALTALAFSLEICGDPFAILNFSSHKRRSVSVSTVKSFTERLDAKVRRRIAALRPGAYTRIGTAIRHVTTLLEARTERHRLLILLSDGKPNDLDHYEGRYAVEDTRMAVREARRRRLALFAVTVDRRAESYIPRIFGRGGYAMVGHLGRLPEALPAIYRQLVT